MKRALPILVCLCGLTVYSYAQHKSDSLRKERLREIEVLEKKRTLKADSMSPVLRLEGRLLETPQNIVGVTSDLIREQGGLVMKDIARNASGVKFGYNSSVFDASTVVLMRGFSAASYLNGMPQRSDFSTLSEDAAIIERVDFIKGPAGFLISSGEPGGSMNITTKTPRQQRIRQGEIAGGSYGLMRASADIGSTVQAKGFSYRMNAAYQQQNSFMDFIKTKKYVAAPVVQYNFSPGTYVLAEYDLVRITSDGGSSVTKVGTDADVLKDRIGNNYAGDPGLPQSYTQTQNFRLFLSHRLNERWRISLQSKYTITPAETWYLMSDNYSPVNFDSTNITRRMPVFNSITGRVAAAQVYVNGQLNSGNHIEHRIAAGVDYNYSKDNYSNAYGQYRFAFDRTHPQYGLPADSVHMLGKPSLLLRENGWWSAFAYSTTRLYSNWLLNFGGRFTLNTPVTTDAKRRLKDETAFSPRLGITRLFGAYTAVYALYDQSFIPQPGADFEGNDFKPLRGNSFELGAKREWFQQRLITSLSAYRIVKNNLLVTDLQHRGYRRQIGQATSTGVDVDVMGRISERLSVSANYAYTHAVTSKDSNKDNEGARLAYIPEQTINSWIQYSIPLQASSRLSISAGQSTVTRTATYTRDVYLKGYTKFDAGVAYDAGKWYVRIVADNITNRRYFSSGDILVGAIYPGVKSYYYVEGEPLSVKAFVGIRL